jgi:hypothetical protein
MWINPFAELLYVACGATKISKALNTLPIYKTYL